MSGRTEEIATSSQSGISERALAPGRYDECKSHVDSKCGLVAELLVHQE